MAGVAAGCALGAWFDRAWIEPPRMPAPASAVASQLVLEAESASIEAPADLEREQSARWNALRLAFLDAAAPVQEALDRADRLRAELPEVQRWVREAEAGYQAARRDRELAEFICSRDAELGAPAEARLARIDSAAAETRFGRVQNQLEDLQRTRQRLTDLWVGKGVDPAKAERVAAALLLKDTVIGQRQAMRAQAAMDHATAEQLRLTRYGQPRRARQLEADVLARRVDELAWQAAWEKARSDLSRLETQLREPALSRAQQRLLDRLLHVVRASEPPPLEHAGALGFQLFLGNFESGLEQIRAVSVQLRAQGISRRYDALLERLQRAEHAAGP